MNAPFQIAQLSGQTQPSVPSQSDVKIVKPQNGQAVTVNLTGNTRLDFSDVASEKLTFVRVGDKLVVLFENQSTVTIGPVFGADGNPSSDIAFEMSPERTLNGADFASMFPITTDQSVLPAAGGAAAGGPTAGANFGSASVDALAGSGARLDLLGGEEGGSTPSGATIPTGASNPQPIAGTPDLVLINEDGLAGGNPGGLGDTGGTTTSATGSLHINFGTDVIGRSLAFAVDQPSLSALTSAGQPVHIFATTIGGLPTLIGYVGSNPLDASKQIFTISLDAVSTVEGSYTVTFLQPVDHPVRGTEDTLNLFVNVIATDGSGDQVPVVIQIDVNDDSPTAASFAEQANENGPSGENETSSINIDLNGHYLFGADAGGAAITLGTPSVSDSPVALGLPEIALSSDGHTVIVNPGTAFDALAAGEQAVLHIPFTVTDGDGDSVTREIVVTITGTNDVPVVATEDVTGNVTEQGRPSESSLTDTGTIAFSDVDLHDAHTISPTIVATEGALGHLTAAVTTDTTGSGTGGIITWTYSVPDFAVEYLAKGETKVESFTITLDDGNGGQVSRQIDVTITGTNDAPVITSLDPQIAFNEDAGTTNSSAAHTANGTFNFTDVDLKDIGHTATISSVTTSGNTTGLPDDSTLQTLLTLGAVTKAAGSDAGSFVWSFAAQDKLFDYLAAGEQAVISYTVEVDDHDGGTDTKTISVTVTGSNDRPDITVDSAHGDSAAVGLTEGNVGLIAHGTLSVSDVDITDVVTSSVVLAGVSGPTNGISNATLLGMLSLSPSPVIGADATSGTLTWTFDSALQAFDYLRAGQVLTLTYTVKATDDSGAGNNSDTQTVTVKIVGTNDGPVAFADQGSVIEAGVNPGNTITLGTALAVGNVLSNDTDADAGDSKSVIGVAAGLASGDVSGHLGLLNPVQGKFGYLSLLSNGAYIYTLNNLDADTNALAQGEAATDVFTYTMRDGSGATSTTTVTITVTGTNDAPLAALKFSNVGEGASSSDISTVPGNFLSGAADPDHGAVFSVANVNGQSDGTIGVNGLYGMVTWDAITGAYSYTLDNTKASVQTLAQGEQRLDVFLFTITDEHGATSTLPLTVTITGTNDAPVAIAQFASIDEGVAASDHSSVAGNLLSGAADVDHGAVLHVASVDGQTNGTAGFVGSFGTLTWNATTGDYTYMLDNTKAAVQALVAGEHATDTFSFVVADQYGATSTQSLTVTINGTDDAPVAVDDVERLNDTAGIDSGVALVGSVSVLANDSDVDHGDKIRVTGIEVAGDAGFSTVDEAGPTLVHGYFGDLAIFSDGHYTYTPNNNFDALKAGEEAEEVFSYQISDEAGLTSTADLTFTISGATDVTIPPADHIFTDIATGKQVLVPVAGLLWNDSTGASSIAELLGATFSDSTHQYVVVDSPDFLHNAQFQYRAEGETDWTTATVTHVGALETTDQADFLISATSADLQSDPNDGNDVIVLTRGVDHVFGGDGNDLILINKGSNDVSGGAGDDTLVVGSSNAINRLSGGSGEDTFKFLAGSAGGTDSILDFETGANGDQIDLSALLAGVSGNTADHVRFLYSNNATHVLSDTATPVPAQDGNLAVQVNLSGSLWTTVAAIVDTGSNLTSGSEVLKMMINSSGFHEYQA